MDKCKGKRWTERDKVFYKLVEEHPIVYDNNIFTVGNRVAETLQAWKEISEAMCKRGYEIKPKSCRDKLTRVQKTLKAIYKTSKVNNSMSSSKFLDGTLSFLKADMDIDKPNSDDSDSFEAEIIQEKSNESTAGFEFPPITLLSSESDSESSESTVKIDGKNMDLIYSNYKKKQTKISSLKQDSLGNSGIKDFKPTEITTSKTIVSLDMIEALLKSKTDSSNTNPAEALEVVIDGCTLPIIIDQTNVDQNSVAVASSFALNHHDPCATSSYSMHALSQTVSNSQENINIVDYDDIPVQESNCNTVSKMDNSNKSGALKENTSIFDINSEEDDIEVFLNEVADYVSNTYSLKEQMDIRSKIFELVTEAEIEEIDQQYNPLRTEINSSDNLALKQLAEMNAQSHVSDLSSD